MNYQEQIKRDNDRLREEERKHKSKINYLLLISFIVSCVCLAYVIGFSAAFEGSMIVANLIMIWMCFVFISICIWISFSKGGTKIFLLFIPPAAGLTYLWVSTLWDKY
jgi:FtsH-binding integral membrane protein